MEKKRKITALRNEYTLKKNRQEEVEVKHRTFLYRRLTVLSVFTVVAAYFFISTLFTQSAELEKKQAEKVKLEQTLVGIEKKQSILEDEIVKLNDDEYVAKLARSEYFLSDEGEIIFNIPEDENEDQEDVSH